MADLALTGASALLAFQRALDTTGHNIANVATDGYSRQRVDLQSRPGQQFGNGFFGTGVQVDNVERLQNRFVFDRMLDGISTQSRLAQFSTYATRLDGLLSNASSGLAGPLQGYFDALQALSADPTSAPARNAVLGAARLLTSRFDSLQGQVDSTALDINARLTQAAREVTDYAAQVATLNKQIVQAQSAAGGKAPNDLLDQRDQLLSALSQRIGISTVAQDDGSVNVFTANGQSLVVGFTSSTMSTTADPYQPQRMDLAINNGSGLVRISGLASGGTIGGLLDYRREVLDPANGELGRLATALATAVNTQHAEGMDAYGQLGGNFFADLSATARAATTNTGGASLDVSYANLSQLTGDDVLMRFDGANWSATNVATGASVTLNGAGTIGFPFDFNGLSVVVNGAANAGDSFLVQPTAGNAGALSLVISDPARIATANPLRSAAALSNTGTGTITAPDVTDVTDPALLNPASIVFTSPLTYSVDGGPDQPYVEGSPITANGWTLSISGVPSIGDTLTG